jgi:predicted dehydrogenase
VSVRADDGHRAPCVAIVGAGSIGMRHLDVAMNLVGVRAVVIPVRAERLTELQRAGVATAASLREVAGPMSQAIVATATGRHLADGLEALELGFDVLMEKPLACDAREGQRLLDAARASGRRLMVGYTLRFSDSLTRFREWLARLGAVHAVRVECRSYLPDWRPGRDHRSIYSAREREGGVLLDVSHEIDYAGWIFGWPKAVSALLVNTGRLGIESEEAAHLRWTTDSGTVVTVELDYLSRPSKRLVRAAGEHGTLEWNGVDATVTFAGGDGETDRYESRQTRNEMLARQLAAFLSAGGSGTERLATGVAALRSLEVIDAARRSSASRAEAQVSGE